VEALLVLTVAPWKKVFLLMFRLIKRYELGSTLIGKRLQSSGTELKTTPPRVYEKIRKLLDDEAALDPQGATPDHIQAIQRAKLAQTSGRVTQGPKWGKGLLKRLEQDGGSKIVKTHISFFHFEFTRFVQHCSDIKGLKLDDALLQLDWSQRMVADKVHEALTEAIVYAKESGFDLSKTYIADAYVKNTSTGISQQFIKKFLRGRGRYGATPHAKISRLEFILQEREKPFAVRVNDPLEWVRVRLRERRKEFTKTAEEIYQEYRERKPIKPIYVEQ
jgi:ribosomal protein L22